LAAAATVIEDDAEADTPCALTTVSDGVNVPAAKACVTVTPVAVVLSPKVHR